MSCPYFQPTQLVAAADWKFRPGMPLAAGWQGVCVAPGACGYVPALAELQQWCNFGYASGCCRCPADRPADKISFLVTRREHGLLLVAYATERDHRPVGHGTLQYDEIRQRFAKSHADPTVVAQAQAYVTAYLAKTEDCSEQLTLSYAVAAAACD